MSASASDRTGERVVVGISGGVDSSVAAWLLKQQGYEVVGLFMKNWEDDDDDEYCSTREDWIAAASAADVLGIDIEAVNFAAEYRERVSLLINIEKTVVEGAGAAGLAAVCAYADRFKGRNVGLVMTGGNIDTRLLAGVLTRELAREGRLSQLSIDLADRPGQLAKVANLLGEAGANIVEVYHQRVFTALPAKGALLEAVIETRDRAHLDETVARLRTAGLEVEVHSNCGAAQ